MKALLLLLASVCSAQTLIINSGGQATGGYLTDQAFIGGTAYGPASQSDPGWKALTGIYSTLRYGTAFSYDFAVPNGSCSVKLDLIENRPAVSTLGVPASGVGLRVFTVTINGVASGPIDIFSAAGAQTRYSPPPTVVAVTNGHVHLDFRATVGNAVVSGIEITCTQPHFTAMACIAPGTANSNCAGLFYFDAVTAAGTSIKIIGAPPTQPIDPTAWSVVP